MFAPTISSKPSSPINPLYYYKVAEKLVKEIPNSFCPNQYANQNNPLTHYKTTGKEIWRDTAEQVTHVVIGMGLNNLRNNIQQSVVVIMAD